MATAIDEAEERNGAQVHIIDLRSDTVTKPTPEMRKAMAEAEVGDDVYGDDPTVIALQQKAAEMFGKEAALYVPSGTMSNLIACMSHCKRGEEAVLGDRSHIYLYEQGGISSLGGIFARTVANYDDGTLPVKTIKEFIRGSDYHNPITRMVGLENTHNACGGRVLKTEYVDSVAEMLHTYSQSHADYKNDPIKLHMDGARIFNASVFLGEPVSHMAKSIDSVSVCLSKGLGAPVGSILIGKADFIHTARRWRKALGGGMRQSGVLAAAGLISLTQMVDRLADDHAVAKIIGEGLKDIPAITVLPFDTNIVFIEIKDEHFDEDRKNATIVVELLKLKGVWSGTSGSKNNKIRFVVNHHVTPKDAAKVVRYVHEVFESL